MARYFSLAVLFLSFLHLHLLQQVFQVDADNSPSGQLNRECIIIPNCIKFYVKISKCKIVIKSNLSEAYFRKINSIL